MDSLMDIPSALEINRLISSCIFSSYTMLLYDHLLTMGKEIEDVWPTPWNLGKCLYFATKYSAVIEGTMNLYKYIAPPTALPSTCAFFFKSSFVLMIFGMLISELVLVFRTWAVWGQRSVLAISLLIIMGLLVIPCAIFAYVLLKSMKFTPSPIPRLISCWAPKAPFGNTFIDYILIILFESVIMVLTMYKGVQHLRRSHSGLVRTLYRDGVLYYVYLIAFSTINALFLAKGSDQRSAFLLFVLIRCLHSILTTRILLNLREAARNDSAKRTSASSTLDVSESSQVETCSALSSVVIGTDTWFRISDNRQDTASV